jgi:hypothetical protein
VKQKSEAQLLSSVQGHVSSRLLVPLHIPPESITAESTAASSLPSLASIPASRKMVQSHAP